MATALVVVAVLTNAIKGVQLVVSGMMWPYWTLSYRHGFIRRGLAGTVMLAMTPGLRDDDRRSLAMQLHVVAWVAICAIVVHEATALVSRSDATTRRLVHLATAAIMLSQFIPTMGAVAGYLDVYIMVIALVAARLARERRWLEASMMGAIGPLIHDGFAFLWLPIVACALFDLRSSRWRVREVGRPLLWLVLPFLSEIAVLALHSPSALTRCFLELPPGAPDIRVFEMPLGWMLDRMRHTYAGNFPTFALAVAYYGAPAAVALACVIRLLPRSSRLSGIATIGVALLPCTILLVAWDLSRFLVWMYFGAFVVLCHAVPCGVEGEVRAVGRPGFWHWRESALLAALVLAAFGGPTTYSYFDHTFVDYRVGPALLSRTPGARLSLAFASLYGRRFQSRSYSTARECTLESPSLRIEPGCRVEVMPSTLVQTPPLSLAPGTYVARVRVEALGCATASGSLAVHTPWRLAPPEPPPIAIDALTSSEATLTMDIGAEASAMGLLRVAVEGHEGCFRVTSLEISDR